MGLTGFSHAVYFNQYFKKQFSLQVLVLQIRLSLYSVSRVPCTISTEVLRHYTWISDCLIFGGRNCHCVIRLV